MPFTGASYDSQELAALTKVFDTVCSELHVSPDEKDARQGIAKMLITAADDGERDSGRLRELALKTFCSLAPAAQKTKTG